MKENTAQTIIAVPPAMISRSALTCLITSTIPAAATAAAHRIGSRKRKTLSGWFSVIKVLSQPKMIGDAGSVKNADTKRKSLAIRRITSLLPPV